MTLHSHENMDIWVGSGARRNDWIEFQHGLSGLINTAALRGPSLDFEGQAY